MFRGQHARITNRRSVDLQLEPLENRLTPAQLAPLIRLDLVALHEIGHALGLEHIDNSSSILYEYLNNNYDLSYFDSGNDPAVAAFQALYSPANVAANVTPWRDALDSNPNDGVIALTYGFDPSLTEAFGADLLTAQDIIVAQLTRWASASLGTVTFTFHSGSLQAFDVLGLSQNDPRVADIRFGSLPLGIPGNVVGQAFFAPNINSGPIAGDIDFASEETWLLTNNGVVTTSARGAAGSNGSIASNLTVRNSLESSASLPFATAVLSREASGVVVSAAIIAPPTLANPSSRLAASLRPAAPVPLTELRSLQRTSASEGLTYPEIAIAEWSTGLIGARKVGAKSGQTSAPPVQQAHSLTSVTLRTFPVHVIDAVFGDESQRAAAANDGGRSTMLQADGAAGTLHPLAALVGLTVLLGGYWAAPDESRDPVWLRRTEPRLRERPTIWG